MTFFQVDGKLDLHYKLIGEGSTKVLFITGIQTTMGSWRKQMEYFASQPAYECCYVDNRGVGLSSAPVGAYSYGSV
jgi:pimeloyl-ACP methyl ester carboxylesterase